jgi:hypothetical protein
LVWDNGIKISGNILDDINAGEIWRSFDSAEDHPDSPDYLKTYPKKEDDNKVMARRLAKKAARLGNWDFDVREGQTWKVEAGEDGKQKLTRVQE